MQTAAATALVLALVLPGVLLPVIGSHAVDVPNARSSHVEPVPRIGGVALLVAVVAGVVVASPAAEARSLLVALVFVLVMAVVGLVDDVRNGVSPMVRLAIQAILSVGAATYVIGTSEQAVQRPFAMVAIVLLGAFWLTGFTNAFNFMDGIDGVSLLTAIVAAVWLGIVARQVDATAVSSLAMVVAGGCAGLLPWNFPRARLFIGDAGSYLLGSALAVVTLAAVTAGTPPAVAVAPLLIYGADTTWTLARRIARGRGLQAHREHVYQRLIDLGYSHSVVAVGIALLAGVCCAWTAVAEPSGTLVVISLPAAICVVYLASPALIGRFRERGKLSWSSRS